MDGSGYFSSDKSHWSGCLKRETKEGKIWYEHEIVQAVLMRPGKRQVLALAPEEVTNTDGWDKPDCEEEEHKLLMEWVNEQRQWKEVSRLEVKDKKGRVHIYEWINEVPLNGNKNTLWVNYFEYWLVDGGEGHVS
jgi:hypothetical protein